MLNKVLFFKRHKFAAFTFESVVGVGGDMLLILVLIIRLEITFTALQFLQTDVGGTQP